MSDPRPFTKLSRCSFARVAMQVDSIEIKGGIRDHIHEYPHSPGGQPEKLGRKVYVVTINASFMIGSVQYPKAWPDDINFIVSQLEQQITDDLDIPTVGTFKAYGRDWDRTHTSKTMNGEKLRMVMVEDSENDELVDIAFFPDFSSVATKGAALKLVVDASGIKHDLFDLIAGIVSQLQAVKDQVDLIEARIAIKARQLADACRFADETIAELNQPPLWPVVQALHDLCVTADTLANDSLRQFLPMGIYTLPVSMTVAQVSNYLYGHTGKAVELMKLNPFENPFAIPALFNVQYYPSLP
jgi:hypothetical protein